MSLPGVRLRAPVLHLAYEVPFDGIGASDLGMQLVRLQELLSVLHAPISLEEDLFVEVFAESPELVLTHISMASPLDIASRLLHAPEGLVKAFMHMLQHLIYHEEEQQRRQAVADDLREVVIRKRLENIRIAMALAKELNPATVNPTPEALQKILRLTLDIQHSLPKIVRAEIEE